jgi:DNA-binding MarR family transcriptional regulator
MPKSTVEEIADALEVADDVMEAQLAWLERRGYIRKTGRLRDGKPEYVATRKGNAAVDRDDPAPLKDLDA